MLVGLQIAPRVYCKTNHWPYNTNTEGLIENFNKLCFKELPQNILRLVVSIFFSQKSSKCAKLSQLMVSKTLIFHIFMGYKKRLVS